MTLRIDEPFPFSNEFELVFDGGSGSLQHITCSTSTYFLAQPNWCVWAIIAWFGRDNWHQMPWRLLIQHNGFIRFSLLPFLPLSRFLSLSIRKLIPTWKYSLHQSFPLNLDGSVVFSSGELGMLTPGSLIRPHHQREPFLASLVSIRKLTSSCECSSDQFRQWLAFDSLPFYSKIDPGYLET